MRRYRRRVAASCLLAGAAESILCPRFAAAVVRTFTATLGSAWNASGNWNPNGVPTTGDTAFIPGVSSTFDTNVTYDYTGAPVTLAVLRVSKGNPTAFILSSVLTMSANNLTATDEFLADTTIGGTKGRGVINQSGGTNTTSFLMIGNAVTDIGNYNLSGTGVLHATTIDLGISGSGNYNQSGGVAQCTTLDLGGGIGSVGNGTISGGVLAVDSALLIGDQGNGSFTQTSGSVTPDVGSGCTITLGNSGGSNGTYSLSGGTLGGTILNVGNFGMGSFLQSGGTVLLNSFGATAPLLRVGYANNAMYSLGNTGAITVSGGSEIIGDTSNGSFTQSGGTNAISFGTFINQTGLTLGNATLSTGAYNLSGGTLSVTNGNEVIGVNGTGTFTQTGGTNTMNLGYLVLGSGSNSAGYYTISGGAVTANFIGVGMSHGGPGHFAQNGGTVTCQTLGIANNTNDARGDYTLTAGSLTMGSGTQTSADLYVSAGLGTFTQSGGTVVAGPGVNLKLHIGSELGSNGAYVLSDGTLSIPSGAEYIGQVGNGTFNQSGGTNSMGANVIADIGVINGSAGTYNLSGGLLSTVEIFVGDSGNGTFHQTGGTVALTDLIIAYNASSHGSYTLDAGTLQSTNNGESVGFGGIGTFNQTGGSNILVGNGLLDLGPVSGGYGVYNLSGGIVSTDDLFIYRGAFNQTGGTLNISGISQLLVTAGTSFNLSGSGSVVVSTGTEYVGGNAGVATFTQTGGSNILNGTSRSLIAIGGGTVGANGVYSLDGGTLNALNIFVGGTDAGPGGNGTFNLNTNNTLTVRSGLTIYSTGTLAGSGATNAFTVNNGAISPGNNGAGILGIGPLICNTGARLYYQPGDLITSSNGVNIAGTTRVSLNGPFTDPTPLMTYAVSAAGASNLTIAGSAVGYTYTARNDAAGHTILAVPSRVANVTPISFNGQPGPVGQFFVPGLSPGAINDSGTISFLADLSSSYGPITFDGRSFNVIALNGQPAPGAGGGTLNGLLNYLDDINASGQTAFQSYLAGTSDGSTFGVFRGDGNSLVSIAREKQVLPNGGGTITSWPFASVANTISSSGQVPVVVFLSGASDSATAAVLRGDGNTITSIARSGQTAPGAGGGTLNIGSLGSSALINGSGQVAFYSQMSGTNDGSQYGIFRGDGNSLVAIIRQNQPAPGAGGGSISLPFQNIAINDAGQVAFGANLSGAAGGAQSGMYRGDGNGSVEIARSLQPAPGAGGGTFSNSFNDFGAPAITTNGQVAFTAGITGASDGSTTGVFRGDGNSTVAIARQKQIAPNTAGATFNSFGNGLVGIAPGGQVAFVASLAGTLDGLSTNNGIFVGDGTDLIPVAISGQTITTPVGNRIVSSSFRFGIFNSYGQLPWSYNVNGLIGDSGNFLFTPVLHWRSPSSGNWDTSANWTLGLAPAYVHDVIIDPSSNLTITGPAANTTIRSLTIGTVGSGAAKLRATTGTLRVTGPLSITSPSKLDLNANDLVYGYSGAVLPLNLVRSNLVLGYAGGSWLGGGITSSAAAATAASPHPTALGYATAGAIGRSAFDGFTVASTDVLVKYTYCGDANLDGTVNSLDFNTLASQFNGASGLWSNGDFNFDGTTNALDFNVLAANYGQVLSAPPLGALVPEPQALLAALAACLLTRRSRCETKKATRESRLFNAQDRI